MSSAAPSPAPAPAPPGASLADLPLYAPGAPPRGAATDRVAPPLAAELCRNCGDALGGAYCAGCGQRHVAGRLTVAGIWEEVLQQVAVADRGLWYTVVALTRDPGRTIRRYLDGERRRFLGPITYLSILTAIELLVLPAVFGSLDGGLNAAQARRMSSGPHPLFTPGEAAVYLRANTFLTEQMLWTSLVMLGAFAFFLRRAFKETGVNTAEATVFAIYTYAHAEALYIPLVPVVALAHGGNGARFALPMAIFFVLAVRAGVTVFGGSPLRTGRRIAWAYAKSFAVFSFGFAAVLIAGVKLFVR